MTDQATTDPTMNLEHELESTKKRLEAVRDAREAISVALNTLGLADRRELLRGFWDAYRPRRNPK